MNLVVDGASVIAIVEAVKIKFPQVQGYWTILLSAVIGLIAGYFKIGGLDIVSGLILGLGATGTHAVATAAGGN